MPMKRKKKKKRPNDTSEIKSVITYNENEQARITIIKEN
jgi:hypothetical protein